jgi:hypothetical protein
VEKVERSAPPAGVLRLALYAVVDCVDFLEDEARLSALEGLHVLAPGTVAERFAYRNPGLYVFTARVYRRDEPFEISDAPHFAGCHSWVDLRNKLPTSGLTPVLRDEEFRRKVEVVRERLRW